VHWFHTLHKGGLEEELTLEAQKKKPETFNEWADYWRYEIGVNVIPADTRNKKTWITWSEYQNEPIPLEMHDYWKKNNMFNKGIAIIAGRVYHNPEKNGLYLAFIDLDNQKAIDEFCTRNGVITPLKELAKRMIVEQHEDDLIRAHVYCYSTYPFVQKSSDITKSVDSPAFEVKGSGEHGIAYCSPSPHKNGSNYEIIGTMEPETLDVLEEHIDTICKKYGIAYLNNGHAGAGKSQIPMQELHKPETIIYEGHNRHLQLLRKMESLIKRNPFEEIADIKSLANKWNEKHCRPVLDNVVFEEQWKNATKFIEKKNNEQQQQEEQNYTEENIKTISVLEAKRKHYGTHAILGKIVTVGEMYVVELDAIPPDTGIIYKDAKSIQLEDIEKLDENERLDVTLFNNDIDNVVAGEVVEIIGNNELVAMGKKDSKVKRVVTNATSIKYVNRKELVIRPEDIKAFEKFAFEENLIPRLVSMFAPNVVGHDDAKEGLLLSIVGGDDHGQRGGGRINTFLVGDPGTAKSTLAEEAAMIKPNSRHVSAPHASSKTITAIAEKENENVTLRLDAIPLSRNAICAIDEVTAFSHEEQARLLDVLEMGILPLDKHGRHWTIPAPTTIIATANPIQSRWTDKNIVSKNEIDMIKTLQDRFQQTFVFRDIMNKEEIDNYTKQMSIIRKRRVHNYNFLRKYLIHASTIEVRKITPEAEYMLNEFWKEAKTLEIVGFRLYRDLFIIAEAHAKLELKDVVDEEIAKQTIESIQLRMVQHGQTVKLPINPKVVTYNKFLKILQNNKVGVTVKELCRTASYEDQQISAYLGMNWLMESNIKVKVIVGMLKNHSSVKVTHSKPLVLHWVDNTVTLNDRSDTTDTDTDMFSEEFSSYDTSLYSKDDNRNEENNVKSGTYQVSDVSVVSFRNRTDRQTERLTNISYELMLSLRNNTVLNHLQYGLKTCQYCGQVADAKHHNCLEKQRAIAET